VMRNAEIYRKVYGAEYEPGKPRPRPP
jgi:hypothetical protein